MKHIKKITILLFLSVFLSGCLTSQGRQIKDTLTTKRDDIYKQIIIDSEKAICNTPGTLLISRYGNTPKRWNAWKELCIANKDVELNLDFNE